MTVVAAAAGARAQEEAAGRTWSVASHIPTAAAHGARPVDVIDRDEIELSGALNLWDLLRSRIGYNRFGLYRPGGQEILVDGRPASVDYDAFPISAIERIEILHDSAIGLHGGAATAGAVNIVLRHDLEGAEVRLGGERPTKAGGDAEHGSVTWGGAIGEGRMLIGTDVFRREEIRSTDREFSRARWTPGGSFADAAGVNEGGNTVYIPTRSYNDDGSVDATFVPDAPENVRSIARSLGDCTGSAYTGALADPGGVPGTGCGFAYDQISWQWESREREALFVNIDHPMGDDSELYADVRYAQTDFVEPRYAPPVGHFEFVLSDELKRELLDDPEIDDLPVRDDDEPFAGSTVLGVDHRFAGHGNRNSKWDIDDHALTLGVRGRLAEATGYDAYLQIRRYDANLDAATFVSRSAAQREILLGRYDIENPLSTDPEHLDAVRETGLRLTRDVVTSLKTARASLDGTAFALRGGDARWAVGAEVESLDARDIYDYRDVHNRAHKPEDVLGSSGNSYSGERESWSVFTDAALPLLSGWDVLLAGRRDEYDDVGATLSYQIGSRYAVNDHVALRGSWGEGAAAPSLRAMHVRDFETHPRVCDTRILRGDLQDCPTSQVPSVIGGNPYLKPHDTESFSLGAEANAGPVSLSADWFGIRLSDTPATLSPQTIVDLDNEGRLPPGTAVVRGNGGLIERIENAVVNTGASDVRGFSFRARTNWNAVHADMVLDARWIRVIRNESRVGGVKQPGDFPRDRLHASLRASRGDVTAIWSVYGVSGYWNTRRTGRYDGWIGHDVALRWRNPFGADGMELIGGVLNIGDRDPSTDPTVPGSSGANVTLDTVRGRTLFLTAKVSFDP